MLENNGIGASTKQTLEEGSDQFKAVCNHIEMALPSTNDVDRLLIEPATKILGHHVLVIPFVKSVSLFRLTLSETFG